MSEPITDATVDWTDNGWYAELQGIADPKARVPVVALAVLSVGIFVVLVSTLWLLPVFLGLSLTMLNPRGGTAIYGLEIAGAWLELHGMMRVPLHTLESVERGDKGLQVVIDGHLHSLELQGSAEDWDWIVTQLRKDLQRHGKADEVPAPMAALRENPV